MGNLLCKFRPPPRRRPLPGRCRPLVTPACAAAHPVRDHPAVPALACCPGRRPFHRDRGPLPASFHVEPKRRYPIPQALCSPLGLLPLVNWKDPPKKPVLSSRNSMMFGPSRTVRIPPLGHRFTVLRSLPQQTEKAVKPEPSSYLPSSSPKKMGEEVQEVPREGIEDFVETRGQDDGNRAPHSSGDILLTSKPLETGGLFTSHQCSPAPVDLSPNPSGDSLGENTQISLVSSPSEGPVFTSSHGPAGDLVPLQKPDRDTAVLSNSTSSCPLLQERLTKEVVAENHQPIQSIPDLTRKEIEGDKPSGLSPEYSFPPVSATSRPCKRKISMPLFVPLPSPIPLQWDRGELPPPPKLPCIAIDKNLGTLKNTEGQRNKILEDGAEILAACWAAQPAPSSSLLASETTDSLPLAIHTPQVPVPTTDLADLSARPPFPSVPSSSPTENIDQEKGYVAPTLAVPTDSLPPLSSSPTGEIPLKNGDPLHPVITITPISDPSTPNTSAFSLQPPSCKGESPTPMCIDSPPLSSPTLLLVPSPNSPVFVVQDITSQAVPPAIIAKASTNLTSDHTSNSDIIDMDTTPPSHAVIFRSPLGPGMSSPSLSQCHCSRKQKHSARFSVFTSPSKSKAACPTAVLNQHFSPNIIPQPTQGTLAGQQQTAFLPTAGISTGLLMNSGTTTTQVGSTSANCRHHSDPDAMDTTPPSQAIIFHSPPQSKASQFLFYNTPPSSSTAVARNSTNLPAKSAITQTSTPYHSAPGITSRPIFRNQNGQQPGSSYLLGKPVAPTQATGPTALAAQPSKDGIMRLGLAASAFGTTVNNQKAFGDKTGTLPVGISTTTGCAVATGMSSAVVSSSLIILTPPGLCVFTGPAAPMNGGSSGFGGSVPGPTHSQVSGAFSFGAGQQGAPSTTSAPLFGQITQALSQDNKATAVGGASTVPVFGQASGFTVNPGTWGQPVQTTGGAVVGNHNTDPTIGGSSVPSTLKCTQGSSKQRKPAPGGKPATKEKRNGSGDLNQSTKSQLAQSTGITIVGKDNTIPTVGGSSVPVTFKCTRGSSKQRKPAPGGKPATKEKRNESGDLNQSTKSRLAQSTGITIVGKDNTIPTVGGSSVPVTFKCTRGSSKQRKPTPGGKTTTGKRDMSRDVCVSPLNLSTRGQPAQSTSSTVVGKDNTVPTIGGFSVPTTHKGTQGSSKQKKSVPGGKATTTGKKDVSRDMCVSPLNLSMRGRPTQSTGSTVVGKDNTVPTVGGSSVPTTHKCTQGSSKQKKPAPDGKATPKEKRNVSKNMCVYPLQNTWGLPGHTTSVVVASTSTSSVLQPTTSSLFPPSTWAPPAQHTGGIKDRNKIIPKTGKSGIPALHQYNCGPPDANTGGTDEEDIVSMMAALHLSSCPQNTWILPSTNTGGAMGISTTSTRTGNTNGPPLTQTTWSSPNHSTDGTTGDSAMKF